MWSRNNRASLERNQRRLDAGIMSLHYPEVANIVISMKYNQRGIANPIHRTLNYFPESYALFRLDCLSNGCVDGGFDLTQIISAMIRSHRSSAKGELTCESDQLPFDHSDIVYDIEIQFA